MQSLQLDACFKDAHVDDLASPALTNLWKFNIQ